MYKIGKLQPASAMGESPVCENGHFAPNFLNDSEGYFLKMVITLRLYYGNINMTSSQI